jgi:hypothetical protein
MFDSCLCDVLSCVDRGICDRPITRRKVSHRASNCMRLRNLNREEEKDQVVVAVMP